MSNRIFICYFLILLFLPGVSFSAESEEHLISLLFTRIDKVTNIVTEEVYPLGWYKNGHFKPISNSANEIKNIFQQNKNYKLINRGKIVGEIAIQGVMEKDFTCLKHMVGIGVSTLPKESFSVYADGNIAHVNGYEKEKRFEYAIKAMEYIAIPDRIEVLSDQIISSPFSLKKDDKNLRSFMLEKISNQYKFKENPDIKINSFLVYDLNGDGVLEYMISADILNTVTPDYISNHSVIAILQQQKNGDITAVRFQSDIDSIEDIDLFLGSDYSFIDVVDLDTDGIAELIVQLSSGDATSYAVYRFSNTKNRFEEVAYFDVFNC